MITYCIPLTYEGKCSIDHHFESVFYLFPFCILEFLQFTVHLDQSGCMLVLSEEMYTLSMLSHLKYLVIILPGIMSLTCEYIVFIPLMCDYFFFFFM